MPTPPVVDLLATAWSSLDSLASGLGDHQWKVETDCPGWTVQDNLAHIVGTEKSLLAEPQPDLDPDDVPEYVHNPIGLSNEAWVQAYRTLGPALVLSDFRATTKKRLDVLRAMSDDEWAADSWTPIGPGTYADFMDIRVFDSWVHELDMRRALDLPGHLDGPVAVHGWGRVVRALPMIVGKRAGAPEGASVVFTVTGPLDRSVAVGVEGRAKVLDEVPASPTATVTGDLDSMVAMGCGRRSGASLVADGKLVLGGDVALATAAVDGANFMI